MMVILRWKASSLSHDTMTDALLYIPNVKLALSCELMSNVFWLNPGILFQNLFECEDGCGEGYLSSKLISSKPLKRQ